MGVPLPLHLNQQVGGGQHHNIPWLCAHVDVRAITHLQHLCMIQAVCLCGICFNCMHTITPFIQQQLRCRALVRTHTARERRVGAVGSLGGAKAAMLCHTTCSLHAQFVLAM
jgi:hypothetical protein